MVESRERKRSVSEVQTLNEFFSSEIRRDPYAVYERLRAVAPVTYAPESGIRLAVSYDAVKQVLSDSDAFSSRYGPDWLIFAETLRPISEIMCAWGKHMKQLKLRSSK